MRCYCQGHVCGAMEVQAMSMHVQWGRGPRATVHPDLIQERVSECPPSTPTLGGSTAQGPEDQESHGHALAAT